jgi:5'-nucleotidase
MSKPEILLTNDDGIQSPGLWAAAESLSDLGYVHVVAPQDQTSGMGRSFPRTFNGSIQVHNMTVNGKEWQVFAVSGSPAQTVLHAVYEILPEKPDLVVSGINYGENLGTGVSASGTVGAAMEAATMGIPSLAISLETNPNEYLSYSDQVDFSTAAYFTAYFGQLLLGKRFPPDVDLLKVDVPCDIPPDTGWDVTRLSRIQYFEPVVPKRESLSDPASFGYNLGGNPEQDSEDTDVYTLRVKGRISVTPLSLDFTSRVDLEDFEKLLREED